MGEQEHKSFQQCVIDYERLVSEVPAENLFAATIELLEGLNSACSAGGFIEKKASTVAREHWYTRAASALTRFFGTLDYVESPRNSCGHKA